MNPISTTVPASAIASMSDLSLPATNSRGRRVSSELGVSTRSLEHQGATGGQAIPIDLNIRDVFKVRVDSHFTRFGEYQHANNYKNNAAMTPGFSDLMCYLREQRLSVDEINYVLNSAGKGYNTRSAQEEDKSFADSIECKLFTHELTQLKRILCGRMANLNNDNMEREKVSRKIRAINMRTNDE